MKFLVVGHLCLDVIHPHGGDDIQSLGGIYYAAASLAAVADKQDVVIPVFGVNAAEYDLAIQAFAPFPNVDTSSIFAFDNPTNRVHLYYKDDIHRVECSKDIAPPIAFDKLRKPLNACDAVLVNMISGSDVTLETIDQIRMELRGHNVPVHFDFHSLTLGVLESSERIRRPVVDWRRWAFMIDTIQMNEEEIAGLTPDPQTEQQTVGHLLTLGVHGVVVTRAERGASVFANEQKHVTRKDIPGVRSDVVRDTTGCGDIFGAAFISRYARDRQLHEAAEFAVAVASEKAGMMGSESLTALAARFRKENGQ